MQRLDANKFLLHCHQVALSIMSELEEHLLELHDIEALLYYIKNAPHVWEKDKLRVSYATIRVILGLQQGLNMMAGLHALFSGGFDGRHWDTLGNEACGGIERRGSREC